MAKKNTKKQVEVIQQIAEEYQNLARQQKQIDARIKPLKQQLLAYAEENKSAFDEAFQLKFPCGTYISYRVSEFIEGSSEAKMQLAEEHEIFQIIQLDEKAVLAEVTGNKLLQKLLLQLGLKVAQKEVMAVYAG